MRRVKYPGKTHTQIKKAPDVATVALFGTAGLAMEIRGDLPFDEFLS